SSASAAPGAGGSVCLAHLPARRRPAFDKAGEWAILTVHNHRRIAIELMRPANVEMHRVGIGKVEAWPEQRRLVPVVADALDIERVLVDRLEILDRALVGEIERRFLRPPVLGVVGVGCKTDAG